MSTSLYLRICKLVKELNLPSAVVLCEGVFNLFILLKLRSAVQAISFPESPFSLTSGRKTRALGATILKQPNSGDSAYPVSLRSLHLRRMPEMIAPRALVFRPLVKGNEDSGNEIAFVLVRIHLLTYATAFSGHS